MLLDLSHLDAIRAGILRASFKHFCEAALKPLGQKPAAHHLLLIDKLQDVADGKIRRLMVCMPPGSAKTTYVSTLYPAWRFARAPRVSIIAASHTADLAEKISGRVQDNVRQMSRQLGCGLRTESKAAWESSNGGEYKAAGIGGPLTGRRADLGIIDDPVKNADELANEANREKTWDWFVRTFRTRLKPGGAIVLVMTRWHADDLGGRVLELQGSIADGGMWDVVKLPAQAVEDDPLGRAPGEWLWGDDSYNYAADLKAALAENERQGTMQAWEALYQQNPLPAGGSIFRMHGAAQIYEETMPPGGNDARAWDFGATAKSGTNNPDFTVGVRLSRQPSGLFVVKDVVRFRGGPDVVRDRLREIAERDGRTVRIGVPQDPGQAGKAQVLDFTRLLSGFRVESSPETGAKDTRAAPAAAQWNGGNIALVRADWNAAFLDELAAFPNGAKDDQVDALSRAFSMVGLARPPMRINMAEFGRI